jgi:hypothetical protein
MDGITGFDGGPLIAGPLMPPPPPPGYGAPYTPGPSEYGVGSRSGLSSPGDSACSCNSPATRRRAKVYSTKQINKMTPVVQSWSDVALQQAIDPRLLIANAEFGALPGSFIRTTAFSASSWIANTFAYNGTPSCVSLHTDDTLAVAEAAQWTFAHQVINVTGSNPPALSKIAFLRAGTQYQMLIDIDLGASNYIDLLLSFRDNAAVPGDFASGSQGTIPAIKFAGTLTGVKTMKLTLKMPGTFIMGLKAVTGVSHSMFEMEWVVVP